MSLPFNAKKRKVLVRIDDAVSDPAFGCDPYKRSTQDHVDYGIVLLNKPQGPTSHDVADSVKKILQIKKAGHSGTLDPNVTGLLVIALSKVTRVIDSLLKSGKEYVCLMRLHTDVDEKVIRETLASFVGEIEQMPPLKSAIKRQLRTREIYYLELLEVDGREVLFRVGCQAGTYIRKLCTDAGEKMGTKAHMQELVRTKVAHFEDKNWVSLHDLKDAYVSWKENDDDSLLRECIQPVEEIVKTMPKVWLLDSAIDTVCHGAFLSVPGVAKLDEGININDRVAMMSLKGELIGIGFARMNSQNLLRQEKGVAIGDTRIFMPRKTYEKYTVRQDEKS